MSIKDLHLGDYPKEDLENLGPYLMIAKQMLLAPGAPPPLEDKKENMKRLLELAISLKKSGDRV